MSLKQQIDIKLNEALKAKDKNTYPTLRLIVSAIKDVEIAGRSKGQKEITNSDITSLLKKMIKQRNESCEVYKKAGRNELLENEMKEIKVINTFLPKQLNHEETKKICQETIKLVQASTVKDMGKVMGVLKEKHADEIDFSKVSVIIKELLN
ncbi:GatB/YqeY domain-containing protein [Pelagibacteraceae bacterium]|nr:GatB/YqeY domain-containing protein [Pelagibacteraceae bacterium]MDC1159019.1 GatB/YqeY domain-containing protein [Pelagibacteraceae bacterium]